MSKPLSVQTLALTPFQQNTRFLWIEGLADVVVVDPGGEPAKIFTFLEVSGLRPLEIWLTHSHIDHCGGVAPLLDKFPVPLRAHPGEQMMRERIQDIAQMYGLPPSDYPTCPEPDVPLQGGEVFEVLERQWRVYHTPGHSPGSLSFYCSSERLILSGDVLFQGAIGRTDLPGGNQDQLLASIAMLIEELPKETRVLSGHGPDTTLEREARSNPFLIG